MTVGVANRVVIRTCLRGNRLQKWWWKKRALWFGYAYCVCAVTGKPVWKREHSCLSCGTRYAAKFDAVKPV